MARDIFNTIMLGQPSPVHHTTGETNGIEAFVYWIWCAQKTWLYRSNWRFYRAQGICRRL